MALLLKFQIFTKALGLYCRFTNMPLPCTKHLGISWGFTIGSPGAADGGPAEIPASSPVLAAGKGRGNARGVPRAWFAPDSGPGLRRRVGSTAAGSGRRYVPVSGEAGARPRQSAAGLVPAEARGGPGVVAQLRKLVATRLGGGAHGAVAGGAVAVSWCSGRREGKR
jgi:hypothetical protein